MLERLLGCRQHGSGGRRLRGKRFLSLFRGDRRRARLGARRGSALGEPDPKQGDFGCPQRCDLGLQPGRLGDDGPEPGGRLLSCVELGGGIAELAYRRGQPRADR
ncbi:MAG TPA: hypothetical protein VGM07_07010 [Stellaceae bacterium]|jgi:hypothetical protein